MSDRDTSGLSSSRFITEKHRRGFVMNRKPNAPKCILGVFVIALFLAIVWSTTTAQLSTISTNSRALAEGAFGPVRPAHSTTGTILMYSAPNVALEALQDPFSQMAPMAKQAGNLDQARNGSATSPTSPVDWVNGNAGASNSHYREGYSIPYRLVLTNLSNGAHVVDSEWDIRHSSKNALDYITHYNRLNNPNHQSVFGHPAETINPTAGIVGLVLGAPFAIPPPPVSTTSGTVGGLAQPTTSFNNLSAG